MSFLPKIRFLGKSAKKISPLAFQANIKIYFARFASNIKFCFKKPIRQQSLSVNKNSPSDIIGGGVLLWSHIFGVIPRERSDRGISTMRFFTAFRMTPKKLSERFISANFLNWQSFLP